MDHLFGGSQTHYDRYIFFPASQEPFWSPGDTLGHRVGKSTIPVRKRQLYLVIKRGCVPQSLTWPSAEPTIRCLFSSRNKTLTSGEAGWIKKLNWEGVEWFWFCVRNESNFTCAKSIEVKYKPQIKDDQWHNKILCAMANICSVLWCHTWKNKRIIANSSIFKIPHLQR